MIKTNIGIKVHNRFDAQLIDSVTGVCKQTAVAENVVLTEKFWDTIWRQTNTSQNGGMVCHIGLGTGTGEPKESDTGLFRHWSSQRTTFLDKENIGENSFKYRYQATFLATSGSSAEITEVGLLFSLSGSTSDAFYYTHAMFTDAEGQPLVIHKTDLDILKITATIYMTINSNDKDFLIKYNGFFSMVFDDRGYGKRSIGLFDYLTPYFCLNTKGLKHEIWSLAGAYPSERLYDRENKTLGWNKWSRMAQEDNNFGFANSIYINGHGGYLFPNSKVYPITKIKGLEVGLGDGEKQDFDCPIEAFLLNTDILYKNGAPLTRDVDYTIDHSQNSPLMRQILLSNYGNIISEKKGIADGYGTNYNGLLTAIGFLDDDPQGAGCAMYKWDQEIIFDLKQDNDSFIKAGVNYICLHNFGIGSADIATNIRSDVSYASTILHGTLVFDIFTSDDGNNFNLVDSFSYSPVLYYYRYNNYYYRHTEDIPLSNTYNNRFIKIKLNQEKSSFDNSGDIKDYWGYVGGLFLGRKGNPIHFMTPPAEGDVITLDVEIDRPYKSSLFILDGSHQITFS